MPLVESAECTLWSPGGAILVPWARKSTADHRDLFDCDVLGRYKCEWKIHLRSILKPPKNPVLVEYNFQVTSNALQSEGTEEKSFVAAVKRFD